MTALIERLESNAAKHPDKPALVYFHKGIWNTVTYAQLVDLTNRLTRGLSACRVSPGMRAAVMTPPSVEFFALAFAMLKMGVIPIILDPAIGLKKVGECLAESQPDIFIGNTLTHFLRLIFGWGKDTIKHNLTMGKVKSKKVKVAPPVPNSQFLIPDSPAAVIYTSGSTGLPKGAVYTQGNFSAQLDMLRQTFNISPDEIDLPAFPLYVLIDVLLGATSVIPDISFPVPGKTNPQKVFDAIQKFGVTNMFASPVVLDILSNWWLSRRRASIRPFGATRPTPPYTCTALRSAQCRCRNHRLQGLKRVITAGAPATIPLQEKFRRLLDDHTDLFGIYGATETLPIAIIESREILNDLRDQTTRGAGGCLGKPVDGATVRTIKITDEPIPQWQDSLEVKPNVVGEIIVQGPAVTRSYIHREDANRLSKIYDGDNVIHRMGDVGYFDEQGRLWYCGRKSHRVVTNDDVLFTEQIEGIFNAHPLVYRTALVGVNREPVLWVEPRAKLRKSFGRLPVISTPWQTSEVFKNQDKIKRELIELAKGHPQASRIKTFLFMKKFPTDVRHNSKIIREELTMLAVKLKG